jgi:hypothetical protein
MDDERACLHQREEKSQLFGKNHNYFLQRSPSAFFLIFYLFVGIEYLLEDVSTF